MKTLKNILSLSLLLCLCLNLNAQPRTVRDHRSKQSSTSVQRNSSTPRSNNRILVRGRSPINRTPANSTLSNNIRPYMPAQHGKSWVFPSSPGRPGYWAGRPASKVGKARHAYSIDFSMKNTYPFFKIGKLTKTAPFKETWMLSNLRDKQENKAALNLPSSRFSGTYVFKGDAPGRINVHYASKVDVGIIGFYDNQIHYLVVDTLYVPQISNTKGAYKGTFISLARNKRSFVKVIANHIIYESPIQFTTIHGYGSDFVFTANRMTFKSPYKQLKRHQLTPAPPLAFKFKWQENNIYVYQGDRRQNKKDQLLLNRLYINIMQLCLDQLATTANPWEKDQLLTKFQYYRYEKLNDALLQGDKKYQLLFHSMLKQLDQYDELLTSRELEGMKILVDGDINALPKTPFSYYTMPNQAKLLAMQNEETQETDKLGELHYTPTGDSKLKLLLNVELDFAKDKLAKIAQSLQKHGSTLKQAFPIHLANIEEQPLKINGRTMGKIIPAGAQHIRLEIDLSDDNLALRRLFLPSFSFDLDYTIKGEEELYHQKLDLKIDETLVAKIDQSKILASFNVMEQNPLSEKVVLASMLRPSQENKDALKYVEVLLSFQFEDKTTFKGPYLLSHYALSVGAELEIPFVKHSSNYQIEVSGKAYYENGEAEIRPFQSTDKLIVIDENLFKK